MTSLAVHGCASPFQLVTGSQPRIPSVLSDDMPAMQEGHLLTEADLARTVAMLAASRAAFSPAEASQPVRRALNRRMQGHPGRIYQPGDVVQYWEQSDSSSRRGMHSPATVLSQAGHVVWLRHGEAYKTRNASDVEPFSSPDPVASPATDPGVVGEALSALGHAAGPASDEMAAVSLAAALPQWALAPRTPRRPGASASRYATVEAVALVGGVAEVIGRDAVVPDTVMSAGAALASAARENPAATGGPALFTEVAAAHRDEGLSALVAHAVLTTRREMRAQNEVSASSAGAEFDAAREAELLAWMTHGANEEVPCTGQRMLSMRWVLTIKPPSLPGLMPGLKARLCARGNEDRDKACIESFSPTVLRSAVRILLSVLVTMRWEPRTVDVSTAFLQDISIDRPSPVWVRSPQEAGVAPGMVWRLAKCAYGLVDAPSLWYKRVCELLFSIGAVR